MKFDIRNIFIGQAEVNQNVRRRRYVMNNNKLNVGDAHEEQKSKGQWCTQFK